MHEQERLQALAGFSKVCPSGPVLLSFWSDERSVPPSAVPRNRLQRLTRQWLRQRVLGLPPIEPGTAWLNGMFVHFVSENELRKEGQKTGWRVSYYERAPDVYPHAVLVPASVESRTGP